MVKPILKIELPAGTDEERFKSTEESLIGKDINNDYHILLVTGTNDYISIEIITASDIKLHLKDGNGS